VDSKRFFVSNYQRQFVMFIIIERTESKIKLPKITNEKLQR